MPAHEYGPSLCYPTSCVGEHTGRTVALINLNGIVIAASHEYESTVRCDVEIAGMRAGLLVTNIGKDATGADFEDDNAIAAKAKARVEELAVRRKMDIRSAPRIHTISFDDLFFSQGASGIIENSDVAGQLSNYV